MVQHADKLATLERREADLRAQLTALAADAQELKNKEGAPILQHCFLACVCNSIKHLPLSVSQNHSSSLCC